MRAGLGQACSGPDRLRVRVTGAVQGVGFRPFVHRLAQRHGLCGFVLNDEDGVLLEIEGEGGAPDLFLRALRREQPALARIDTIEASAAPAQGRPGFVILQSRGTGAGAARGVPDAATCQACLDDLFNQESRFHLYPFVTCADCGPRFTITRRQPYDRANTAMADFAPCAACAADYADPGNRRFHAETIACPACGPHLSHPIQAIAAALRLGRIVALKGIGGFHLLCDATNEAAVALLRRRQPRPSRPFAIMVDGKRALRPLAWPSQEERDLMGRSARPIVLVALGSGLAPSVAPGLDRVGVMLAGAPAHHLLFHALGAEAESPAALVATSANLPGAPLAIDNQAALEGLALIADLIVTHDRPILERADDSVMAMIAGAPAFIRRGRGFAPEPIDLGQDGPAVLAVGAQLKTTVCVTRGREAFMSQHLGDLGCAQTARFHEDVARRMLAALDVRPELVVCDRHPDYRSTIFAEGLGLPLLKVQHHAAHLAAVAAEHRLKGPLIGVALDGHGLGEDGTSWGGELMLGEDGGWRRLGHLRPLPLPGGDRAAREPWRMGVAALAAVGRGREAGARFSGQALAAPVAQMALAEACPVTTSLGRLFDAAAALLGLRETQTYEGQAAMELEALVGAPTVLPRGFRIERDVLDMRPLLSRLAQGDLTARRGAALFHGTLIVGLAEWIGRCAEQRRQKDVALGGGCLANRVLADGLTGALRARGLVPWLPQAVPANDGGLSLGQAALARARLMSEGLAMTTR
jgi:hydrogenase maturation protein HypF